MKKIILLAAFSFCLHLLHGQEYARISLDELTGGLARYNSLAHEAAEGGDLSGAVELLSECNDWLLYLTENDPDYWRLGPALASNYYNIACFNSLAGEVQQALAALARAQEAGWNKFRHALQDGDLDNVRDTDRFREIIGLMREKGDYMEILRKCGDYRDEDTSGYPEFFYEPVTNGRIRNVRAYFQLDTVAGNGDEISRIINIMTFVHNLIPHDGGHRPYCEYSAVDLYNYSKANGGRGLNCRMLAIVLNDCYLSMGFRSRFVTCMPKDFNDGDCHVINAVWSQDLGRWVWMDPSFNAYVTDENGELLGINEVRERMRDGRPYLLNEDANHNNRTPQTREHYLDEYMAKNLYWLQTPVHSIFCTESPYFNTKRETVNLVPDGYRNPAYSGELYITTSDEGYFWQAPVFGGE